MLREMSKMSVDEAFDWYDKRRAEAMDAMMRGDISEKVGQSILEWANDSLTTYLTAIDLGYLNPEQVEGKR